MEFVMGDILGLGMVGFVYYNTTGFLLARVITISVILLAIIGTFTLLKTMFCIIFKGRKKKESAEEKWLRTGKF